MEKRYFPPIHPGEILLREFLLPTGISQYRLARNIGVTSRRINEIIHGRRSITADTALRLGRFFNMDALFWFNLQTHYDMEVALTGLQNRLDKEVHPLSKAA
jgi:antitoxin HigA-1